MHFEDNSHPEILRASIHTAAGGHARMQEPWEAGPPWRAWLLAKMGLPTDQVPADAEAFMEDAIKHLAVSPVCADRCVQADVGRDAFTRTTWWWLGLHLCF